MAVAFDSEKPQSHARTELPLDLRDDLQRRAQAFSLLFPPLSGNERRGGPCQRACAYKPPLPSARSGCQSDTGGSFSAFSSSASDEIILIVVAVVVVIVVVIVVIVDNMIIAAAAAEADEIAF